MNLDQRGIDVANFVQRFYGFVKSARRKEGGTIEDWRRRYFAAR
jgi:hypothetical protein